MYYILSILGQDVRKTLGVGMQQLERLKISFKESLYCKVNGKERSVEFKVIYCVITFKVIYVRNNSFDQISMTNIRIYNELKQTGKVEIIKQLIFQIVSIARRFSYCLCRCNSQIVASLGELYLLLIVRKLFQITKQIFRQSGRAVSQLPLMVTLILKLSLCSK